MELKDHFKIKARAVRDGSLAIIDSENLVPGDIIIFEAGDKIPADLRLIEEESLMINESSLTGESVPVSKNIKTLPLETSLADRLNMIFAMSEVASGRGRGIVVATGEQTEFGKIAELIDKPEEKTPLEKQVAYLGKILTIFSFITASMIFVLGYYRNYDLFPLLTFTIALLVAAVPESLPTAITLALALGVSRMAKKKAIVRKMSAIETLGTTNIIVTDKTGTITNNNLIVDAVFLFDDGKTTSYNFEKKIDNEKLITFFSHGLACSNLNLNDEGEYLGDPVEIAIVERADLMDKLARFRAKNYKRLMEIPFDSDKKFMAVLVESEKKKSLIVKGACEKIVDFCSLTKIEKKKIIDQAELYSKEGYKVIALADKHLGNIHSSALSGMKFRGLFAMVDEPTTGIKEAIAKTMRAGIRTIIITGDHSETARFVANKVGLDVADDEIVVQSELENMSKAELLQTLAKVKIFARVTPEGKILIVKTLQDAGFSVAMTGDGVNDAPALREAQVGIAMGIKGTDVAKDSADIVLLDDKYNTIVSAIEYGRAIYDNIKNVIVQLFSGNLNEVFLVIMAFVFGLPVPFTTAQILWINLIIESFAALSFCFEKPSNQVLSEKPRTTAVNSLKKSVYYAITLAVISIILGFSLYLWGLNFSIAKARTLIFCFVVFTALVYSLSIRSNKRIWQSPKSFLANKYLLGAISLAAVLQISLFMPPMSQIFQLIPLTSGESVTLGILVIFAFLIAEVVRFFHDKRAKDQRD